MPGIILSLLATLLALSFAFHTDDWSRQYRKGRRNIARQISKSNPAKTEDLSENLPGPPASRPQQPPV